MRIRPLADRIVIEPADVIDNIGGIELPSEAQERPLQGKVFAAGDGNMGVFENKPLTVKVGDTILYSKFSGSEFIFMGKKYLIMRETDVLLILEE